MLVISHQVMFMFMMFPEMFHVSCGDRSLGISARCGECGNKTGMYV